MKRTTVLLAALVAALAIAPGASAAPKDNAIQPSPVYFGAVQSGQHPTKTLTVKNVTAKKVWIHSFGLAGAGGGKFTNTWRTATCTTGLGLRPGQTCTIVVRVKTTRPEFYTTVQEVSYGGPHIRHKRTGQFNVTIYAHVV